MSAGTDFSGSEIDLVVGWILDLARKYSESSPGLMPYLKELVEATGHEDLEPVIARHASDAMDVLVVTGLVSNEAARGGSGMGRHVWLTDEGRTEAALRAERRANNGRRRLTCRNAVLHWAHEQLTEHDRVELKKILTSPFGWYCGEPYEVKDLVDAAVYLREHGLAEGPDDALRLTANGSDCVERYGDIVSYLNDARTGGGITITVQGDNHGQLAVGNRDVTQTQSRSADPEVLKIVIQALREFAKLLPDQAAEYEEVAAALDSEAKKAEPDRGWVKSLLDRARGLLAKANSVQGVAQLAGVALQVLAMTQGPGAVGG